MKQSVLRVSFLAMIVCLSGCGGRVIDWTVDHFYQGCPAEQKVEKAQKFIRSVAIHDQFETLASFVVLWLSNEVRTVYSELYSFMRAKNDQEHKALLRRQLSENDHYISFFVLSANDVTIGEPDSLWAPFLIIDGHTAAAHAIKTVDLLPEYKMILGKKLNRFQRVYLVTYSAKNADGQPLITSKTSRVNLELRSLRKTTKLSWSVDGNCGQDELPCKVSDQCNECQS